MGAYGVRLDIGFTGAEEAKMTRNPFWYQNRDQYEFGHELR